MGKRQSAVALTAKLNGSTVVAQMSKGELLLQEAGLVCINLEYTAGTGTTAQARVTLVDAERSEMEVPGTWVKMSTTDNKATIILPGPASRGSMQIRLEVYDPTGVETTGRIDARAMATKATAATLGTITVAASLGGERRRSGLSLTPYGVLTITVPAGETWRVTQVIARLITAATAPVRTPRLFMGLAGTKPAGWPVPSPDKRFSVVTDATGAGSDATVGAGAAEIATILVNQGELSFYRAAVGTPFAASYRGSVRCAKHYDLGAGGFIEFQVDLGQAGDAVSLDVTYELI
jgi:hypothetical protein